MLSAEPASLLGGALVLCVSVGVLAGLGRLVLRLLFRKPLPFHWHLALSVVAGTALTELVIETAAISGASTSRTLVALAGLLCLVGIVSWFTVPIRCDWSNLCSFLLQKSETGRWQHIVVAAVPAAGLALNFAIALAPSTKIDELHYHMLTPKRILQDGGLVPYWSPAESGAIPQMHYQIALVIFHALGLPDAGNLVSMIFAATLGVFVLFACFEESRSRNVSLLTASTACVGLYSAVNYTTSGPAALGDLALAVGATGLVIGKGLAERIGKWQSVFAVALCTAVAAGTKLSIWPVAVLISVLHAAREFRTVSITDRSKIIAAAALPWVICHTSLIAFTWLSTGAPFGPIFLAGPFRSVPGEFSGVIESMRLANQTGFLIAVRETMSTVSPILPFSVLAILLPRQGEIRRRLLVLGLIGFQLILIAIYLPHQWRFLSGLPYAALPVALATASGSRRLRRIEMRAGVIAALALGPWLISQGYFALPFAKTDAGLMDHQDFRNRYVATWIMHSAEAGGNRLRQ